MAKKNSQKGSFVAETGKLTNQIVEDFLKFCEMPDCKDGSGVVSVGK